MARGPLPDANARRRNAPTIPTTNLPVGGRKGRPPSLPAGYDLGEAGLRWWKWSWTTPQAVSWDAGSRYTVARRAQLEDDLSALGAFSEGALERLFEGLDLDEEALERVLHQLGGVIGRLKGLAGGRLAILKEMRELEAQLGLGPKALAALRWKIVAEQAEPKAATTPPKKSKAPTGRLLYAVDPAATAAS